MTDRLHYLTVQDILWANLQATRRVNHYQHARLEEATYYQYAYGESNSVVPQAARFLTGFVRMAPFDGGNAATAFIGALAFMVLNGRDLALADADAPAWLSGVLEKRTDAATALDTAAREPEGHAHHESDPRTAIRAVIDRYPQTLRELLAKS